MGNPAQAQAWPNGDAGSRSGFFPTFVIRERQAEGATVVRRSHNTRMIDA